jgi:hypothetical protein
MAKSNIVTAPNINQAHLAGSSTSSLTLASLQATVILGFSHVTVKKVV